MTEKKEMIMNIEKIFETRRFHLIAGLLIALAALLVYSNTFHASFHFDDTPQIVENYQIRNLDNLLDILKGQRGLTMATFAINYAIGGLNVVGYHIVNLAIHIMNGIMVYFLVFITLRGILGTDLKSVPKAKRIAIYTALLFAVHPIQTQAVTYIVQRMEILASMFMLIALLLFIKAVKTSMITMRVFLYGIIAVSYILGFYSKEIAITLPALVFIYDYCFLAEGDFKKIMARMPLYFVLLAMLAFFTTRTLTGLQETPGESASAGFGVQSITSNEYLFTQFNVLWTYLRLLILPINQNLDYDYPVAKSIFEFPTFLSFVGILLILVSAFYLLTPYASRFTHYGRLIAFFILWFFVILSPTSSFIPIIDVIFEHRLYLASVGFFVLLSLAFDSLFKRLEKGGVQGLR